MGERKEVEKECSGGKSSSRYWFRTHSAFHKATEPFTAHIQDILNQPFHFTWKAI